MAGFAAVPQVDVVVTLDADFKTIPLKFHA